MTGSVDLDAFDVLTFDCYGTLIDWETGLLAALRPVLEAHGVSAGDDELLETYARHEAELEAGEYLRYRELLGRALQGVGRDLGFEPTRAEVEAIGASVGDWPAFEDSAEALARLHERYKLAPITNCDDDLFALSAEAAGRGLRLGDHRASRRAATSRAAATSSSPSRRSTRRASASCTSRRACSTTT